MIFYIAVLALYKGKNRDRDSVRKCLFFMHQNALHIRQITAHVLGGLTALLLARLVLRLLAARPDNPILAALLTITTPPRALVALDVGQPHFGAILEFSTLALIGLLLIVGLLLRRLWQSR